MRNTKLPIYALVGFAVLALSLIFAHRIAVNALELWAHVQPTRTTQSGGITVETDRGNYEMPNAVPARAPINVASLDNHMAEVRALSQRLPQLEQIVMPPDVRWFRYRPAWYLDMAMATNSGQVWITYVPRLPGASGATHPEYLGQLYAGTVRRFILPREPYYNISLEYYIAAIPFVWGTQLQTGENLHWAILPNGSVVNSQQLPANLRGFEYGHPTICKQGSPQSATALYGLLPNGRWQPILSWRQWQAATLGVWHYDPLYPLECAGRFGGYFWVNFESAGVGALYRVRDGTIVPVGVARPYLVTDHAMILSNGDQIIEAHSP